MWDCSGYSPIKLWAYQSMAKPQVFLATYSNVWFLLTNNPQKKPNKQMQQPTTTKEEKLLSNQWRKTLISVSALSLLHLILYPFKKGLALCFPLHSHEVVEDNIEISCCSFRPHLLSPSLALALAISGLNKPISSSVLLLPYALASLLFWFVWWTRSSINISFVMGSPRLGAVYQLQPHKWWLEGINYSLLIIPLNAEIAFQQMVVMKG